MASTILGVTAARDGHVSAEDTEGRAEYDEADDTFADDAADNGLEDDADNEARRRSGALF